MGLLLGWMAWHSGSAIPSMVLHVVHNSTLLMVVQSRDILADWNIGQLEQQHLPWEWLAVSAAMLVLGTFLIRYLTQWQVTRDAAKDAISASSLDSQGG